MFLIDYEIQFLLFEHEKSVKKVCENIDYKYVYF